MTHSNITTASEIMFEILVQNSIVAPMASNLLLLQLNAKQLINQKIRYECRAMSAKSHPYYICVLTKTKNGKINNHKPLLPTKTTFRFAPEGLR